MIDPGDEVDRILIKLGESNLNVKYILNTHGHFDHVGGNKRLKEVTGADLMIHRDDVHMLEQLMATASSFGLSAENSPGPDQFLEDGQTITLGDITLKVIHTPGHSPGGVSFHTDKALFVGDTLFAGSIGRTDLPGGDYGVLIASIQQKLFPLGDDIKVYTGHGPETTIEVEKRTNPFARL